MKALQEGRSDAREKDPVEAVEDSVVDKILPHCSRVAADVVRFMRFCGCRPGEVKYVTVEAIDRTNPECWECVIDQHKSSHKGKRRTLYFGPRCQAILRKWILKAGGSGPVFPLTHSGLRTAIGRACVAAGVDRFGPNALRHRAGTEARKQFGLDGAGVAWTLELRNHGEALRSAGCG